MTPRRPSGDDGSVLLLLLGFAVVLVLLVVVVIDVSVVLLTQRAVASAADGAAVAAAQELDETEFYRSGLGGRLPLSTTAVAARVDAYERAVQPATQLSARVEGGTTVVVQGERQVDLPFARFVGGGSVTVHATARARSPVVP